MQQLTSPVLHVKPKDLPVGRLHANSRPCCMLPQMSWLQQIFAATRYSPYLHVHMLHYTSSSCATASHLQHPQHWRPTQHTLPLPLLCCC